MKNADTQSAPIEPVSKTKIPVKKPRTLKHGHNMYTATLSSLEIERGAAMTLPDSLRNP